MASRMAAAAVDGVLVQWGDRLFYPRNRIGPTTRTPRLSLPVGSQTAWIRRRIEAAVIRHAPQVMVKVTGGGRGMGAIAAHFRYISKAGRLAFEDDRGVVREGREALHDLAEQWRYGGSLIGETSPRREALNLMLSMPRGTSPQAVLQAARELARIELKDHRYVMVLHEHQENPHVHLSVRAESMSGQRLNPRKADLHRWRETFAERLRGQGIEAEATRQAMLMMVSHRVDGHQSMRRWANDSSCHFECELLSVATRLPAPAPCFSVAVCISCVQAARLDWASPSAWCGLALRHHRLRARLVRPSPYAAWSELPQLAATSLRLLPAALARYSAASARPSNSSIRS